jgi:hypothetical protein
MEVGPGTSVTLWRGGGATRHVGSPLSQDAPFFLHPGLPWGSWHRVAWWVGMRCRRLGTRPRREGFAMADTRAKRRAGWRLRRLRPGPPARSAGPMADRLAGRVERHRQQTVQTVRGVGSRHRPQTVQTAAPAESGLGGRPIASGSNQAPRDPAWSSLEAPKRGHHGPAAAQGSGEKWFAGPAVVARPRDHHGRSLGHLLPWPGSSAHPPDAPAKEEVPC